MKLVSHEKSLKWDMVKNLGHGRNNVVEVERMNKISGIRVAEGSRGGKERDWIAGWTLQAASSRI